MDTFVCSCGAVLGEMVEINRRQWLRVGTVEVNYLHGRCCECQSIIHFDSLDYVLDRLIERSKRAKMNPVE